VMVYSFEASNRARAVLHVISRNKGRRSVGSTLNPLLRVGIIASTLLLLGYYSCNNSSSYYILNYSSYYSAQYLVIERTKSLTSSLKG